VYNLNNLLKIVSRKHHKSNFEQTCELLGRVGGLSREETRGVERKTGSVNPP